MKFDADLVRAILFETENIPFDKGPKTISIDGYTDEDVNYHIAILNDKGLIVAKDWSTLQRRQWAVVRLTYDGHEFLEKVRSESVWKKAKSIVSKSAGPLSIEALKITLSEVLKVTIAS